MSAGSVNVPGTLDVGSLSAAVTIGRGGAIAINNSGSGSAGAVSVAGPLTCASISSAGDVAQPRYSLRVFKNALQSISAGVATAVVWDAVETGGAVNWPFAAPASLFTCPVAGMYSMAFSAAITVSSGVLTDWWIEVNPPGGSPGSTRQLGTSHIISTGNSGVCGPAVYARQLAAGDTVVAVVKTANGASSLNLVGNLTSTMSIVRLSE